MPLPLSLHRPRRIFLWVALLVAVLGGARAAYLWQVGDLAVLCLHGVEDPDPRYAAWSVSRERLEEILARVASGPREVVGPEALERLGDGTFGVLLTFDDARASHEALVPEALEARGWRGVFFAPTRGGPRQLDDEALRSLEARGHRVASHSRTHARFHPLEGEEPEATRARLGAEAAGSREELRELLGRPVTLFAYPRGDHPPVARAAVREAGYRWAFTTEYGYLTGRGDPLASPRFMVSEATTLEQVDEFLRQPRASLRLQLQVAGGVALMAVLGLAWTRRRAPASGPATRAVGGP